MTDWIKRTVSEICTGKMIPADEIEEIIRRNAPLAEVREVRELREKCRDRLHQRWDDNAEYRQQITTSRSLLQLASDQIKHLGGPQELRELIEAHLKGA